MKSQGKPGKMANTYGPSTQEAEVGRWWPISGQPCLHQSSRPDRNIEKTCLKKQTDKRKEGRQAGKQLCVLRFYAHLFLIYPARN